MTTTPFVAADQFTEYIDDSEIQILDARITPPGRKDRDVGEEYHEGHIPDAVFFDIEALSDHTSPLPHMMSHLEVFAAAIHELDVDQDKHLVIHDNGNLFSVPRAWWMLRTFGAENVSILAGSSASWRRDELMLREGNEDLPEDEFNVTSTSGAVARITGALPASHEKTVQVVDARPAACLNSEVDESCLGPERGHVPGVLNVPWTESVRDGGLKAADKLGAIFFSRGVNFDRPVITSCGPGITTAVVMPALAALDVSDAALYDGTWNEWGARSDLPIEPQL